MIDVLDYGMGNIRSVCKAIEFLGGSARVVTEVGGSKKLIIPGVGAFPAAMEKLRDQADLIRKFAKSGNPLLGICLGQQLLFEGSEEHYWCSGLGILGGKIKYLPKSEGIKIPHIGWNSLTYSSQEGLTEGGKSGEQVYFDHSLYAECSDPSVVVASTNYGTKIPAIVRSGSIWGCQFHPEKSGQVGLRILKHFLEC